MNGVELNLVKAVAQLESPDVMDFVKAPYGPPEAANNPTLEKSRDHQHRITNRRYDEKGSRGGGLNARYYRLVEAGALVATRVSAGVAAILTSTSLTGFWVQAWVT